MIKVTIEEDGKKTVYEAKSKAQSNNTYIAFHDLKLILPELTVEEAMKLPVNTPLVVWDYDDDERLLLYFATCAPNANYPFYCFAEWEKQKNAKGIVGYKHARLATKEEIEQERVIE